MRFHLRRLASAQQLLIDGTFRITPNLWYQTFIINAQVTSDVFIPVVFALLPDKKRESYDAFFSALRDRLDHHGLQLSARYLMSGNHSVNLSKHLFLTFLDFEAAIRDSCISHIPEIEPKGCSFHFCKAIISKVARNGFKGDSVSLLHLGDKLQSRTLREYPSGKFQHSVSCPRHSRGGESTGARELQTVSISYSVRKYFEYLYTQE